MPALGRGQRSADEVADEGAEVDAHVEDGEGAVAARVAGPVEVANLGRDVGLEGAVADDEQQERNEEPVLVGHGEVAERHEGAAEDDRLALSPVAVGEVAAEDGGRVDEARVPAVEHRGVGADRRRWVAVDEVADEVPADDRVRIARSSRLAALHDLARDDEEVVHHVELQEPAHAIVGEALPHLSQEEHAEADGVAKEATVVVDFFKRGVRHRYLFASRRRPGGRPGGSG